MYAHTHTHTKTHTQTHTQTHTHTDFRTVKEYVSGALYSHEEKMALWKVCVRVSCVCVISKYTYASAFSDSHALDACYVVSMYAQPMYGYIHTHTHIHMTQM